MWAFAANLAVVMSQVFAQKVLKMLFAEYKELVQGFATYALNPSLGMGVHFGTPGTDSHYLYTLWFERRIEVRTELAVEITDQVRGFEGLLRGVLTEVFGLLGNPGLGRIGGEAGDVNAPTADMEKEEHEAINEAAHGEDFLCEEIAAPQGGSVAQNELGPSALAALGAGSTPSARRILRTVDRQMTARPSFIQKEGARMCAPTTDQVMRGLAETQQRVVYRYTSDGLRIDEDESVWKESTDSENGGGLATSADARTGPFSSRCQWDSAELETDEARGVHSGSLLRSNDRPLDQWRSLGVREW